MAVGTGPLCCSAGRRFAAEESAGWLRGGRIEKREARRWHAGIVLRWITIVRAWRRFAAEETAVWFPGRRLEEREARGWHAGVVLRWITMVCAWDGVVLEESLGVSVAGREGPVFIGRMTGVEDAVW